MTAQSTSPRRRPFGRTRWAAIGAAVAVTIGGGGLLRANAADNAEAAAFVATTPCRLLDTRNTPEGVGTRTGPLGANETYTTGVFGTHGSCTIPADASSLVMNLTATEQSAASYLTVFPAGITLPGTSNLNWSIGDDSVANAATTKVSASGELSFYNFAGTTHVVVDVVGYYTSDPLDDFYTKGEVDALIAANPGAVGPVGPAGPEGPEGPEGPQGDPGEALTPSAAEFFALMPPDNATTVAVGADVSFPQNGPGTGTAITRLSADDFNLADIGVYRVSVSVPVSESGQLILTLNGADLAYTVAGRDVSPTPITMDVLVQTTLVNSILTVRNPTGNLTALTLTPLSGGTRPVSATLLIERIL